MNAGVGSLWLFLFLGLAGSALPAHFGFRVLAFRQQLDPILLGRVPPPPAGIGSSPSPTDSYGSVVREVLVWCPLVGSHTLAFHMADESFWAGKYRDGAGKYGRVSL